MNDEQMKDRLNERLIMESLQGSRLDETILWLERLVIHVEKEEESLWQ